MSRLKRKFLLIIGISAALGLILAAGLLLYIVIRRNQTRTLPKPTGPYAVGRVLYEWTDESRRETFTESLEDYRELTIWIWYPAETPSGTGPAPYLPRAWRRARERERGIGSILFQSPTSIHAHAYDNAALATGEDQYPVLIFEPGLGPTVSDYTTLLEDLASHGYIIIGVNPTYSSSAVVFSDGRVVKQSKQGSIPDNASVSEARQIGDELVRIWAQDLIFAMNQAQVLNMDHSLFAGRMDLTHIGLFGHSFGGAAAIEACHLDSRCQASIDIDGYLYGDVIQTSLQQPVLFLWSSTSDTQEPHYRQAVQDVSAIYNRLPSGYQITLHDARHFNFTDYAVEFSPVLRLVDMLGSIDGTRGLQTTRSYVLAFFDTYLRNQESPLLQAPSDDFPEVKFQRHRN
jgi:predicted dienelactone hydrolase